VSVAERGHDPGWVSLRVYDDHQPTAWSYVPLEEPFSVRPGVCFSMIWRGDCFEHRPEMGFKLDMAAVRIEHMPQPRVLEKHHLYSLGRCRFGEDGSSCLWAVRQGRWLSRSFAGSGARSQAICLIGPVMAGGSLVVDRARAALYTSATAAPIVQSSPNQDRAIPLRHDLCGWEGGVARTLVHDGIQAAWLRGTPGFGAARR
jgi:hypothetical protein